MIDQEEVYNALMNNNYEDTALFYGTSLGKLNFAGRIFEKAINLSGVRFTDRVCFSGAHFRKKVQFNDVYFEYQPQFDFCNFEQDVDFSCSTFSDGVEFLRCQFIQNVRFWKCLFKGNVNFREAEIKGDENSQINFSWSSFQKPVDFSFTRFQSSVYFWRSRFFDNVLFDECHFVCRLLMGGKSTDVLIPRFNAVNSETIHLLEKNGVAIADSEMLIKIDDKWNSRYLQITNMWSEDYLISTLINCHIPEHDIKKIVYIWNQEKGRLFHPDSVVSFRQTSFTRLEDVEFSYVDIKQVNFDGSVKGGEAEKEIFQKKLYKNSFDLFISHASEDKEIIVRPLANKLREFGFIVWYDEFQISAGDNLGLSIEDGLNRSRYAVIVLSPHYFTKSWPMKELEYLLQKKKQVGCNIIPLWFGVEENEIKRNSPVLTSILGLIINPDKIIETALQLAKMINAYK